MFLAEQGPGFRVGRKLEKLGYHGSDTAEVFFEKFRVPADRLIGGAEGHGFAQIMAGLELGRINIAARGLGLAQAGLNDSVRYAQVRKTLGKPIGQHQAIQLKLAEMATRCAAARLLTESAARAYVPGRVLRHGGRQGEVLRFRGGAEERRGGDAHPRRLRLLNRAAGRALLPRRPVALHRRGTNEIQRIIIARQLLACNPA